MNASNHRGGWLLLAAIFLVAPLALPAAAAGGSLGRAEPAAAPPGAPVQLVFTADDAGLIDLGVQRSAGCEIVGPDGASESCASGATLLVVEVASGTTTYTWTVAAPQAPGNYTVRFHQDNLIGLPGGSKVAETRFEVAPAPTPAGDPLTKGATNATAPTPRMFMTILLPGASDPASVPAGLRWLATLLVGSGTLLILLFAQRAGNGP